MINFIIALVMVVIFLIIFIPIGLLLYRYGFWICDKIDNMFDKLRERKKK